MAAQPRQCRVGVGARQLELDEPVELLEALVAADLVPAGTKEMVHVHESTSRPRAATNARRLFRASCSVLYSAPRVVPRRSASTSIGTPFNVSATSTRRWCGVSSAMPSWTTAISSFCSAAPDGPSVPAA